MGKHAQPHAQADERQHGGWVATHFLHDLRAEPGIGAVTEELVVELGSRFSGAKHEVFAREVVEIQ